MVITVFDLTPTLHGGDNYVYKPNFNLLEMPHTNVFSSIRKTTYQPFCFEIKQHNLPFSKCSTLSEHIYFRICSHIQKMAQNLIQPNIVNLNTIHTKTPTFISNNSFSSIHEFRVPWASLDMF